MYLDSIHKYVNGDSKDADHKIYEYMYALELNMIHWDDLPPNFDSIYDIPHKLDYGVDLVDLTYTNSCQVKKYEGSSITWSHLCKFKTYSSDILEIDNGKIHLATTNSAKIDKLGQKKLIDSGKIKLHRNNFDDLLEKYANTKIKKVRNKWMKKKVNGIELRPYLLSCYQKIMESHNNVVKCQLPCGCGKTYIMLYTILQDLMVNPHHQFIIFIPWIDLAKQTIELFKQHTLMCSFIGAGKRDIAPNCNVVVCVYPSIDYIPTEMKFRYKFIDEAHHLESDDSKYRHKIDKIKSDKTIHFSATYKNADNLDYNYPLNEAITDGWVSDYVLHFAYFKKGNRINAIINMLKGKSQYFPMFVYFNSTKRCKLFAKKLQEAGFNADYLTGKCTFAKRNKVKKDLINDSLDILSLCGVYNEGISIDNIRTVVFGDLRHSDINKIQIMMRASRLHYAKPFYRVIVPMSETYANDDDIKNIVTTFCKIDPRMKDSIKNKSKTRIKITTINPEDLKDIEAELLYEQVYDRLGNFIEGMSNTEVWHNKLNKVKQYIDENDKTPSATDKNKDIKTLGKWLSHQKANYNKKTHIMKDNYIRKEWETFIKEYEVLDNVSIWNNNLQKVKQYINENDKTLSKYDKNKDIKILGSWLSDQKKNYKKKTYIMKDNDIVKEWEAFIEEYKDYFLDNIAIWNNNLNKVKQYIDENNKTPSTIDKNKDIKTLGKWLSHQKANYNKKTQIMKDKSIRGEWETFIKEYEVLDNVSIWNNNLQKVKQYIDENDKTPSKSDKNKDIKTLGLWLSHQKTNYNKKTHIMKDNYIIKEWETFLKEYEVLDNVSIWNNNLNKVKQYIDENDKTPSTTDKNKDIKTLGQWLSKQKSNYNKKTYIMEDNNIRNLFYSFLKEYQQYFKTQKVKLES